jgi:phospholipid-transporting ATPase
MEPGVTDDSPSLSFVILILNWSEKIAKSSSPDSFYKNIVLYMTQFWVRDCSTFILNTLNPLVIQYSFFNNFSGQIAYESWTLTLYNVVFTVLPPLVIGIFDQFVSARFLDRYPQLYILGQKNEFFTKTSFWLWVANALYHSLVSLAHNSTGDCLNFLNKLLYGFSIILFWGDLKLSDGLDSGHWFWGTTLYLAVLLTVLGKAALISEYVPLYFHCSRKIYVCLLLASGLNTQ